MFIHTNFPVSFSHESTTLLASPQFRSPVSFNLSQLVGILSNIVYVPYGGLYGDCGTYHGWIVGVPMNNPSNVLAWATPANGGGAWGVGGVASDRVNPFIATGNTFTSGTWGGGDAIVRLQTGPVFSGLTNDYWSPTNWFSLDGSDLDLGSSAPLLVNVPGATPSQLVVALGKDGNAYLLNLTNLGGISLPLAKAHVSSAKITQAAATYQTTQGCYVAFCASAAQLSAILINAANPPTITSAWTVSQNGRGSPFVTSTDGTNNMIVWAIGSEGDQRLHGYNGTNGQVVYSGGGANELMTGTRRFNTGIAAHGRIYVANDNKVYAFTVPVLPIVLTDLAMLPGETFQFSFTNTPDLNFTVYNTTNLATAFTNWNRIGSATEVFSGQFQFTDSPETNNSELFYRVTSP
jgi:hypothetical protein